MTVSRSIDNPLLEGAIIHRSSSSVLPPGSERPATTRSAPPSNSFRKASVADGSIVPLGGKTTTASQVVRSIAS